MFVEKFGENALQLDIGDLFTELINMNMIPFRPFADPFVIHGDEFFE